MHVPEMIGLNRTAESLNGEPQRKNRSAHFGQDAG